MTKINVEEFSKEISKANRTSQIQNNQTATDKKQIPTENLTNKIARYWWILVIVLVILIVYLAYSVTRKR